MIWKGATGLQKEIMVNCSIWVRRRSNRSSERKNGVATMYTCMCDRRREVAAERKDAHCFCTQISPKLRTRCRSCKAYILSLFRSSAWFASVACRNSQNRIDRMAHSGYIRTRGKKDRDHLLGRYHSTRFLWKERNHDGVFVYSVCVPG